MKNKLQIIYDVCVKQSGVDLKNKSRSTEFIFPRFIYFTIAKELTNESLKSIGSKASRDHVSVLNGLKQYKDYNDFSEFEKNRSKWNDLYMKCFIESVKSIYGMGYDFEKPSTKSTLEKEIEILERVKSKVDDNIEFYRKTYDLIFNK